MADARGTKGPTAGVGPRRIPAPAQRAAFVVALVLLGVLLVTSARTAAPPAGRLGQRVELMALIRAEQARNAAMAGEVEELNATIAALERELASDTGEVAGLQAQVDVLAAPAGMTAVLGPGVTVTLDDAPGSPPPGASVNDYVIHEQDLQAVINALWAGGAEGMAVGGHRVLATTAIRCVGNVLLLHGRTHSPPYVIEAVGDQESLRVALARDTAVARFERAVQQFDLGYDIAASEELLLPAYDGGLGLQRARPLAERG